MNSITSRSLYLDQQLLAALQAILGSAGAVAAVGKAADSAPSATTAPPTTTDTKAVFSIQANGSSQPLAAKAQVRSRQHRQGLDGQVFRLLLCSHVPLVCAGDHGQYACSNHENHSKVVFICIAHAACAPPSLPPHHLTAWAQVVLLGAGLDARAWRLPLTPGRVAWFEIDQADLLAVKHPLLTTLGAQLTPGSSQLQGGCLNKMWAAWLQAQWLLQLQGAAAMALVQGLVGRGSVLRKAVQYLQKAVSTCNTATPSAAVSHVLLLHASSTMTCRSPCHCSQLTLAADTFIIYCTAASCAA